MLKQYSIDRLQGLDPGFKAEVLKLVQIAESLGLNLQISSGFRTNAEQDLLYAIGRTEPGKVVTNARGGQSLHNKGLAVDCFFLVNGVADFSIPKFRLLAKNAALNNLKLDWAGNWVSFKEYCHFQSK